LVSYLLRWGALRKVVATYETKRDMTHAIIWSSTSFAVGWLGGLPGGIHGEFVDVAFEVLTGVFLARLFILSGGVILTSVASVIYYTALFYYLRRESHRSTGTSHTTP
jgi:hypothetical protein